MALSAGDSTVKEVSQILKPRLQNYFRRPHGPQGKLEVKALTMRGLLVRVANIDETHGQSPLFVEIRVALVQRALLGIVENLCLNLIVLTP